ncbi:hypothetical protein ACTXT7_000366 [Hymenolepis weldensis]
MVTEKNINEQRTRNLSTPPPYLNRPSLSRTEFHSLASFRATISIFLSFLLVVLYTRDPTQPLDLSFGMATTPLLQRPTCHWVYFGVLASSLVHDLRQKLVCVLVCTGLTSHLLSLLPILQ